MMNFQFESLDAFWVMAGHGPYVWSAYAIFSISIVTLLLNARMKRKEVLKKIKLAKLRN